MERKPGEFAEVVASGVFIVAVLGIVLTFAMRSTWILEAWTSQ